MRLRTLVGAGAAGVSAGGQRRRSRAGFLTWLGFGTLWIILMACTSPSLFAQGGARVDGFVRDPSGAVIPGASVVLRDQATGTETRTKTDASGFFSIDYIAPKTYTLTIQNRGFKTYSRTGIVIHPGDRLDLSAKLEVGEQVQTVEVQGTAVATIPTDTGAMTDVIGAHQIENLATEGRNAMELLTLLPGVVNSGFNPEFGSNMGQGINQFNVNGLRNDQNSIRLDNANMIDPGNNGGFIIEPNMDMVQEFSVKTSSFEADQGRAALIVDAVTKSGGSKLHGEAYYYGRNAALNANDWSNNNAGIKKPGSKFNYPGFNIGGPVRLPHSDFNKNNDKMFFFGALEWQRQLPDFGTQLAVVPSSAMRQGNFSELQRGVCKGRSRCLNMPTHLLDPASGWNNTALPTNILPQGEIDPNTALLLNEYPLPNFTDPSGNYNFAGNPLYPLNRNEQNFRVDYNLNESTRMYVRASRNHETQYYPWGLWSGIGSGWTSNVPEPSATIGDNLGESVSLNVVKVINPTLTNEVQFNATQLTLPNHYVDPAKVSKSALGFQFSGMKFQDASVPSFRNGQSYGGQFLPQITDQWNFYNGGNPGTGRWGEGDVGDRIFADKTVFEWMDNVTKVYGTHTLKFGGNADRTRNDQNGGPVNEGLLITAENWGGYTTGNSFGDILTNNFRAFEQGLPNNDGLWRFWNLEWYGQDSWKASRKLTLNYGVRFSWMQPWYEARGLATTFLPSAYNPAITNSFTNGIVTPFTSPRVSRSVFPNPHPVPQPRLGFAWDLFGTGKTVLRGGFGTYVSRDQGNVSFYMANADPYSFTATVQATGGTPSLTLADIEAANPFSALGNVSVQAEDPRDPNQPQTYEWNMTFEQNVGLKTIVTAAYVGNVSRHMYRQVNANALGPGVMWIPGTTDCCKNGDTTSANYRTYKPYGNIDWSTHSDTANYNSLQATLRRNVSRGLTLLGSYTWSKTMGYTTTFQGVVDPFDSHRNYGILPYDHSQIFNISYIYQFPNLAARHFSSSKLAKGVLDNWQFSGITHFTSGAPVFIGTPTINCVSQGTKNLCGGGALDNGHSSFQGSSTGWYGTPDIALRPIISWQSGGFKNVGDHWFSASSLSFPGVGNFGTFETPIFRGPGSSDWDMTLFKSFSLGESRRLEFRFSSFDVFNHANLDTGGSSFGTTPIFNWVLPANATSFSQGQAVLANGSQLGTINDKRGHRELELALKLYF